MMPSLKGQMTGTFPRKRFSEEPLGAASPHVSGPGNRAAGPASSIRPARHPVTRRCRFTDTERALNPSPTPDGITETRQPAAPSPTTSQVWCEGDTEVHSILRLKGDWQIQLSGPCGPCSGGRLVLDPSG